MNRNVFATIVLAAFCQTTNAQLCRDPANCATTGGANQVCTEMWNYTLITLTPTSTSTTGGATACTLIINNSMTRTFRAVRPLANPSVGGCNFAGMGSFAGQFTYSCVINEASGLPVELLDFSVEDDAPPVTSD